MTTAKPNYFELFGGEDTFRLLVDEFYAGVATDPLLRPMYPAADLEPAKDRLQKFLIQYWGGPTTYSDERGHPRLRIRHAPFQVGEAEIQAWLRHMRHAVDTLELSPELDKMLWDYFERAAYFLQNS